jgi:uncharacterized membrane protein YgcG
MHSPVGCISLTRDLCRRQKSNVLTKEKMFMRFSGILLFLVMIACILIAGCTQLSGTGPVTTAVAVTSPHPAETVTPAPTAIETAAPTTAVPSTPQPVVTIIHVIPLVKDVKDSERLFSLQVPVDWNVSTHRLANPQNFEGFMYQTDLVRNNTFYIHTYIDYQDRDQNYRNDCREESPARNETTVTINGITFDRFESTANGTTNVTYVARKSSTNERGYLSVLAFSAKTSNPFEKEDYDKVVASFRYYSKDDISKMPGEEIPLIAQTQGEAGNMRSSYGGGSSGSSSGSSSSSSSSSGGGCRG